MLLLSHPRVGALLALTILLPVGAGAATLQEKIQDSRQKLEHIHENLGQMQAHLAAGQKTQAQLRREINAINQQVVVVQEKLVGIQQQQRLAKSQIADLRAKISALQAELAQQKAFSLNSCVPPTRWGVSRHWPSGYKRNVRENWGV